MQTIINPERAAWVELSRRNNPESASIAETVVAIIDNVRRNGDRALKEYAAKFDHIENPAIKVSEQEIAAALEKVTPEVKEAVGVAIRNISKFHEAQLPEIVEVETTTGVRCIQKGVPIQRIGLYIPGGRAPLFSTVLMLACPARIAGCPQIVLATPRSAEFGIAPEILYAAVECGVTEIYGIGGAQAIAALAYGTESINPVHKIFGPGNRYVTMAKQLVTNQVAIDMPAGPSEVLVMADDSADPEFVAADLLSQAEHGPDSQAILVTLNKKIAEEVALQIQRMASRLTRKELVEQSLSQSRIIVLPSLEECIDFVNLYAPEHLIISMQRPWEIAWKITAAGSIFIGNYSPESAGDYASGTNHTLPTSGWATSFSGVNIDSFMRKITYQELTKEGISRLTPAISAMAMAEGLQAHAIAAQVRSRK